MFVRLEATHPRKGDRTPPLSAMNPPSTVSTKPRTLVLCFDGTDERFQVKNTNVVKFFSFLQKDSSEQLVYYQPGIGTYAAIGVIGAVQKWFTRLIDQAFAWYLDIHIMGGYQFLMQNHRDGDRICLLGFSRGAYTARALAGMLHKVGLLPSDNVEQVGFAYDMYKDTGEQNSKLAPEFKKTFSKPVSIQFVGCWETVSSVGFLWSRNLPFTSGNSTIKYFRHAISLDEHRAKFQPNLYHYPSPNTAAARKDPQQASYPTLNGNSTDTTDVLEVWFAGCHADIGGGESPLGTPALGDITLRWMIREVVMSQCGIVFDAKALAAANIPLSMCSLASSERHFESDLVTATPSPLYTSKVAQIDSVDAIQPIHDTLVSQRMWWIPEIVPFFVTWQDTNRIWHRSWRWNLGRPREIPYPTPNIHITVQERMKDPALKYTPRAVWKNKPDAVWYY